MQSVSETDTRITTHSLRTVLLVEDNHDAARLLSMYLHEMGCEPVLTETGEDAIRKAEEYRPDAIILDILLPAMDGWEVLATLKASPTTRDIPVVILSVLDRQDLGFKLGAIEHLVKPVTRAQLARALGKCELRRAATRENYRIVVVDDDQTKLNELADMLYRHGYDVMQALGEAEGVHLARASHPDLVVLDLLVPKVDYADVVADFRADPNGAPFPILVLTSSSLPAQQAVYLRGDVQSVIIRGFSAEETLLHAISQIFDHTTPAREEHI